MTNAMAGLAPSAARQADAADTASRREQAAVRRAAQAFESLLVQRLIHSMIEGQLEGGFFGDSAGASIYEGLLERNLAEHLSTRSPLGLATRLEEAWLGEENLERGATRGLAAYRKALEASGGGISDMIAPAVGLKNSGGQPIFEGGGSSFDPGDDR